MTTRDRHHGAQQRAAQGHLRARQCETNPATAGKRCWDCRYLQVVFSTICGLGDFRTSKNATCLKWMPRR